MKKQFAQLIIIFLVALLAYACNGTKLAVNNADSVIEYQVKKRLPLYSNQKVDLSKDVAKFLNDHKPLARDLFPLIDSVIDVKPEQLPKKYQELQAVYDQVALNFSGVIAKYMAQLDPKQQTEFFDTLNRENKNLAKRDADDRRDKVHERFETFFDRVSSKQKKLLAKYDPYLEKRSAEHLKDRKDLHAEFKKIFAKESSKESKQEEFLEAFKKYQAKRYDHKSNNEFLLELLPTIEKDQKDHFRKKIEELKEVIKLFIEADY